MRADARADRQCPGRRGGKRVEVRDAAGALVGSVDLHTARAAVAWGAAVWRGKGRGRYLRLHYAEPGRSGWAMPASTELEHVPFGLFGRVRRHSRADSWRTGPDLKALIRPGSLSQEEAGMAI